MTVKMTPDSTRIHDANHLVQSILRGETSQPIVDRNPTKAALDVENRSHRVQKRLPERKTDLVLALIE